MIATKYKPFVNQIFLPIAKICKRLHLTPNQVTLICLVLGLAVCVFYISSKNTFWFCILIILVGFLDAVDGALARLTNQATKFGAYLDAVCDRIFEGVVALSVAMVVGYWALIFIGFIGSITVSYAKARAAMEVSVRNTEWPDFMERTERGLVFIIGLFLSEVFRIKIAGEELFFWVLIFLILSVYGTVVQRVLRAKGLIESRE